MFTHDTEYFRRRRPAQGVPARDPFSAPRFQQRAAELQRLEQLPWPRNLFGDLASIAELMAESAHAGENADGVCSCGCRKEHKQNVSQTLRNPYGRSFDVIYFRSEACKNRWNQEGRRRQVGDLLARPGPPDARGVHSQRPCASPLPMRCAPHPGDRARRR
jgi:hypothetical protein